MTITLRKRERKSMFEKSESFLRILDQILHLLVHPYMGSKTNMRFITYFLSTVAHTRVCRRVRIFKCPCVKSEGWMKLRKSFFSSKTDLGKAPQGNLKSLALELSVRVRGREREAETGGINTILLQEYFESSLNRSLTSFFLGNISPLTIGAAGMMAHLYT